MAPLCCERRLKDRGTFLVACVAKSDGKALEFGCRSAAGDVWSFEMTDAQLTTQAKGVPWPAFLDALRAGFSPTGSLKLEVATIATVKIRLTSAPQPTDFSVMLRQTKERPVVSRIFLSALFSTINRRKADDQAAAAATDADANAVRVRVANARSRLAAAEAEIVPLKSKVSDFEAEVEAESALTRRVARLRAPGSQSAGDPNVPGPTRYVLHTRHSVGHVPRVTPPSQGAVALLRRRYAEDNADANPPLALPDADLKAAMAACGGGEAAEALVRLLDGIDSWDFDMFAVASAAGGAATPGGALVLTTLALLLKQGVVGHFGMNVGTVVNFLSALEAGYHPNAYHNATHAADVLQCVHYILGPGGMMKTLSLTSEDVLACVIAAAMHDYDHPGFNNNFHCRTGAYLATLYNDRSVLENHHCAQVFEMLRHEQYNIFASLSEESRKDVRDTILEMVLATDMGLHAKLFQSFRHKLAEEPDWNRKEDLRLALAIAIKMADISNCARSEKLYKEWAKRIAEEFYHQGDVELRLRFAVSPFMDRRRHKMDFHKGQVSFMNYIVIPLFEAGVELLPDMEFSVTLIQQNKEAWMSERRDD